MLKISVKTVENHRVNLMSKLNVHGLAGLMRAAIKRGLILLDEWPFSGAARSRSQKVGVFPSKGRVIPHRQAIWFVS
jgi:hypothetical protein